MSLGSGQKLSMEELKQLHQPTPIQQEPTAQSTTTPPAQKQTTPPEVHPTKEEWEEMMDYLYTLGYHAERQTGSLKKVSELLEQRPTRTQVDELLKVLKHLELMNEQAGKPKEKSFSLPSIRLQLPQLDGPTWAVLMMAVAALLLLWWGLDTVWNGLSLLNL